MDRSTLVYIYIYINIFELMISWSWGTALSCFSRVAPAGLRVSAGSLRPGDFSIFQRSRDSCRKTNDFRGFRACRTCVFRAWSPTARVIGGDRGMEERRISAGSNPKHPKRAKGHPWSRKSLCHVSWKWSPGFPRRPAGHQMTPKIAQVAPT